MLWNSAPIWLHRHSAEEDTAAGINGTSASHGVVLLELAFHLKLKSAGNIRKVRGLNFTSSVSHGTYDLACNTELAQSTWPRKGSYSKD